MSRRPSRRCRSGDPDLPSPARIRSTLATIIDQPEDLRALRVFHKALADVNRLRIVLRLAKGSATVTELIDHVGLSQPLVSWHLGRLRIAGIVQTRRSGRETVCTLRPEAFDDVSARERVLFGLDGLSPTKSTAELGPAEGQA